MKILSIGYGHMGIAFLKPILEYYKTEEFTVVTPNSVHPAPIKNYKHLNDIEGEPKFDMIVFACKPQQIESVMADVTPRLFHKDTLFISILVATPRDYFYSKLGADAKVCLVLPNLPCMFGQGICGVLYDEELECLKGLGQLVYVKTLEDLNKTSAFFGSGPGYVFHMLDSYVKMMKEVGVNTNVDPDWRALTIDLFQGTLDMAKKEPDVPFSELCGRVCSKGGTTEQGVWAMEGLEKVYIKGATASIKRCGELTKDLGF